MIAAQAKPATLTPVWVKFLRRTVVVLALAFVIGYGMRHASSALERSRRPAGFGRGVLQGALMPCALPNLLVGNDVSIYNPNNTGVSYKLGYTCGVNACGAVFFGLFFLRLTRLKRHWQGR